MKKIELDNCTVEYGEGVKLGKSAEGNPPCLYFPYRGMIPVDARIARFEFPSNRFGVRSRRTRLNAAGLVDQRIHQDFHGGIVIVTLKENGTEEK